MLNKVMLIGNVGKDPDMRTTPNGINIATFSLATTKSWKDATGERKVETSWHRIVAFQKKAEFVNTYIKKGSSVYVEGEIIFGNYQNKEHPDIKMYSTDVNLSEIKFVGSKPSGENKGAEQQSFVPPAEPGLPPAPEDDLPF